MRLVRILSLCAITAGCAALFVGTDVTAQTAKPGAVKRTAPTAIPAPTDKPSADPKAAARPRIQRKVSDAEISAAKAHQFTPADVTFEMAEDQRENAPLIAKVKRFKVAPAKPKLNINKFGDAVHNAFKDNVRGYSLGLRKDGQHVYTLIWDWGRTPNDGGKGWTLDTRMHVASVSKFITAVVALKMLDERGFNVDKTIGAYLPDYWDPGAGTTSLTFRKLLTHQANFDVYGGDYLSFKKQIEKGVSPASAIGYTNGSFSLVRVLNATMTGAVPANTEFAGNSPILEPINDALWDINATKAFLAYAQKKVFTPSGVSAVTTVPNTTSAFAYSGKTDGNGWNSGDVRGQLGGAGFRLSVNELLNVMGTFRRSGKIVSAGKAQAALDAKLGLDRITDTPAGKLYDKNGRWQKGDQPTHDCEQSVIYFLPENIELAVLVNSWVGASQASLRDTIRNAYLAALE